MHLRRRFISASPIVGLVLLATSSVSGTEPVLQLEEKIPLGKVEGRIDHLAVDLDRQRLFVAEFGNNSIAVVDLKTRTLFKRLTGLNQPQGLGYDKGSDLLFVANGGDGSVRFFRGNDLSLVGRINLDADADNVRVDSKSDRVYVGHGTGAIAVIDPGARKIIGDIVLHAHPEGFQLDPGSALMYANVPETNQVSVIDRHSGAEIGTWTMPHLTGNFPLAFDAQHRRAFVISRRPARLLAFRSPDGAVIADVATCADADDVFVDPSSKRVYVSCGEGFIDVFQQHQSSYARIGHVHTARGARTSLFVPEVGRLFLAVPEEPDRPAAIWVLRPLS